MSEIEVRVAAIVIHDGSVLLANHQKQGQSYWVLPGGHVERGETLSRALIREMHEELALDITVGLLVMVQQFITDERHVVNNIFMADATSTDFTVTVEEVLKDAKWQPLDELENIDLRPAMAPTIRLIVANPSLGPVYVGSTRG